MFGKIKGYIIDKFVPHFKRRETSDEALNILKLGNKDLEEYFDIINPKVPFGELHKKLKKIKEKSSDSHKKFILFLGQKDKDGVPLYERIIEDSYRRIENRNKDNDKGESVEAKKLLDEVKTNAMNMVGSLIDKFQRKGDKYIEIKSSRIQTVIKLLRGDCFLFNTVEKGDSKYIQFDKEYTNEEVSSQILQYEHSQDNTEHILISRRHIYEGVDLDKMEDSLKKYRKFISYYFSDIKPYVATRTWLNDIEFFKYYEEYLNAKGRDPQTQNTIKNLNLTKRLSICDIRLSPLAKKGESYEGRKKHFIKNETSSLSLALKEYEGMGQKLQEGDDILDLGKL